ncbi:inorganic triphosphatase [Colwellia piezophila]|uniref:CYTH domain-containing protein n=1 Tax=Colwellia piezophila TaxID=211668 RepID=UPI0003788899|nr:CYTH domain-containing protein [Colwellia piezophila]
MATEIELKYSLLENVNFETAAPTNKIISHLLNSDDIPFSYQKKQLSNSYFDTPNLTLRQHKIALRTRGTICADEIECFEQTIKTSGTVIAGLHQRPEYNVDIDNDKPILALFPKSIWQPNIDCQQLQQQIVELFSTNFTRHTWLVDIGNAQVEIAFDSGEIVCQGFEQKPAIYEIELELVNGDAQALFILAKLLFSQLSLRPGQLTKAARGYALYHESLRVNKKETYAGKKTVESAESVSLAAITFPKNTKVNNALNYGVEYILTLLQTCVDSYVEAPLLTTLSKVRELLTLLRQGFWLFDDLLTDQEKVLRSELSYFIRTLHWVDNALYIELLTSKQSSYQKVISVNKELISKLGLGQSSYPSETQVLAILHSERFNNLQLDLLVLLLKKNSIDEQDESNLPSLVKFSEKHLANSINGLIHELTKLPQSEGFESAQYSSTKHYLTAHGLLIRALLTTSWFGCLFVVQENKTVKKFTAPWFDIKQGISELQSLHVLQQKLLHLPKPEKKLALWLANKSENLITALDQSKAKAITMKPYWS